MFPRVSPEKSRPIESSGSLRKKFRIRSSKLPDDFFNTPEKLESKPYELLGSTIQQSPQISTIRKTIKTELRKRKNAVKRVQIFYYGKKNDSQHYTNKRLPALSRFKSEKTKQKLSISYEKEFYQQETLMLGLLRASRKLKNICRRQSLQIQKSTNLRQFFTTRSQSRK